jgi:2-polyprenyl-3-methyl-5-hydroxy-6-metoxy-1,4-benzoquinol methylase
MRISDYFDSVYLGPERYWWRGPERYDLNPDTYSASLLAQQTLRLLQGRTPGRALDIGAGEGSDAIRLAKLGYDVDAVEVSTVGAKKIECFAEEAGVNGKVRVLATDVQDFTPRASYDVIICNGVLHYVKDKQSVIDLMQQATCPRTGTAISSWSHVSPDRPRRRLARKGRSARCHLVRRHRADRCSYTIFVEL